MFFGLIFSPHFSLLEYTTQVPLTGTGTAKAEGFLSLAPSPLLFLSLRKIQCSSLMWAPLSTMSWRRSASAWPTLNTRESVSQGNSDTKSMANNEPLFPKEYPLECAKKVSPFCIKLSAANFILKHAQPPYITVSQGAVSDTSAL